MPKRNTRKSLEITRPIRTQRDYAGAKAVVKKISGQAGRDSAAERRLQSLLKELDKFDEREDDAEPDPADFEASTPRRRWSDGGSENE
jgi:hypothetical protein